MSSTTTTSLTFALAGTGLESNTGDKVAEADADEEADEEEELEGADAAATEC